MLPAFAAAQRPAGWELDKMPVTLETELALQALPSHLRSGATVYLLDPAKGYYVARRGSNGFICFISRTDWEWGEFRKDLFAPIGYDPEGARTIFPAYRDVAALRATGRFTALQIRDSIVTRIRKGIYRAPARAGISYMEAPIMRVYTGKPGDNTVVTMSMPHCMFYAPYLSAADVGTNFDDPNGPLLLNPGSTVLGERKGTKDTLATWDLIESVCSKLKTATLVKIEGADHAFKAGKKDILSVLVSETSGWIGSLV